MCGLVGIYSSTALSDTELNLFKGLLLVDQIRGYHATGVAKLKTQTGDIAIHKRALDATDYLADADTKKFLTEDRGNIYIGHNRWATVGDKGKDANAHPFQQDHITLVHNGGVDSWGMDLLEGYDDKEVVVDSHMVTMTIAKHGVRKAVEEYLSGAFALVWWDAKERSLNFIRNGDRPLFLAVLNTGALVWASEKGMMDVYCDRGANSRMPSYRMVPELIEKDMHYKFLFNEQGYRIGQAPTLQEMKFLELPVPKQAAVWFDYYGSSNNSSRTAHQQTIHPSSQPVNQRSSVNANELGSVRDTNRVNDLLIKRGLPFRKNSIITMDLEQLIAYSGGTGAAKYGRFVGIERESKAKVEAWGVELACVKDVKVYRGAVENAYVFIEKGEEKLCITVNQLMVSCHDKTYSSTNNKPIPIMNTSERLEARTATVTVLNPNLKTVHYPLKVQGHTFKTSVEFNDFVCQGCSICGKIPTPYDRRNHQMTVVEGRSFQGLLSDCDFICGECEEG